MSSLAVHMALIWVHDRHELRRRAHGSETMSQQSIMRLLYEFMRFVAVHMTLYNVSFINWKKSWSVQGEFIMKLALYKVSFVN